MRSLSCTTSLLAIVGLASVASAVTTTYTEVAINSFAAVNNPPDYLRSETAQDLQLSASGDQVLAYGNGSGGFTFKPTLEDVFASSSLASGQLKARSLLGFGSNTPGSAPMPLGHRNASARATASFADSFHTFADNQPFLWTSGDTGTFAMAVSGEVQTPDGLPLPDSFDPGEPKNEWYTFLQLHVYKPGGLEILRQAQNFDFSNYETFEEAVAALTDLNSQITEKTIAFEYWYFGDFAAPFAVDPARIFPADPNEPVKVEARFTPNGDFEWLLDFETHIFLDASHENVQASLNFASTVQTTYEGPDGTTVYSASGLFPGTLDIDEAPTQEGAVPEPMTASLGALSAIALSVAMRRRR